MNEHRINVTRSSMPPLEEYVEELKLVWESRWLSNHGAACQKLETQLQNYLHDYTYRKIYRYEPDLVLKRWWNLIMFTFIYGLICVLSLELIDRDKR